MPDDKNKKQQKERWYNKMRNKYRLVILNEETFEERFSFRLSRLNVAISIGTLTILLIAITTLIIAFTPLREFIPGYTDVGLSKKAYALQQKADSMEVLFNQHSVYIQNIKNILEGNVDIDSLEMDQAPDANYDTISIRRSAADSALRAEYENQRFNLQFQENGEIFARETYTNLTFYTPVKGILTSEFNLAEKHYGVDLVAKRNETVKTVLDGTVIFSDWTVETGYVIGVQHKQNYISVYKHNAALLKEAGNLVKAGEPIAIIGESGDLTTGPHLHFELWHKGLPVDPTMYITF